MDTKKTLETKKRGRPAKLTREQVDEILLSDVLVDVLAIKYDVSISTIMRAKNHGYAAAGERGAHSYFATGRGRKTLNGDTVTEEVRALIAADPSPAADVAKTYGVSRSYVYHLRTLYGTSAGAIRRSPLPREVMEEIWSSTLSNEKLAHLFDLSVHVVKAIRSGYYGEDDA